jgi:hypothetical protein
MSSRTCSHCGFVTQSQVAVACPNCGAQAWGGVHAVTPGGGVPSAWPARLGFVGLAALMIGLGYSSYRSDQAAREAERERTAPVTLPSGTAPPSPSTAAQAREALRARDPRARAAGVELLGRLNESSAVPLLLAALNDRAVQVRVSAVHALADMREPRAVEPLVGWLKDDELSWHAAQALVEIGGPRAEAVLLDALQRRDFGIMAGAHRFYLRRRSPEMEPALLDLLRESGDLAVAQGFIVEGSPRLAEAARAWAGTQGFVLVKTPQGYSWQPTR